MSSSMFGDQECSNQCHSVEHGNIITAAISKRSISDIELCAFLAYTCCRCESVIDRAGRTALHVAASCGRIDLVRWLVKNRHADVNIKDKESGYSALHRSIFYGKIHVAVELLKLGASISDLDFDSLTVLEHAMKDGLKPNETQISGELYSWGSNTNNLLGPQQTRQSPELLDTFHKEYPGESVQQICIDQFHTVIVTSSGKAYSCGHGQGGRLGLSSEKTVIMPHIINFPGNQKGEVISCTQASISRDHSIFLCSDGNVYSCGLNTFKVLGLLPIPEKVLVPKQLKHLSKEIQGVCSGQYHSVAWGTEGLFTWGLNAGQLGHKLNDKTKDKFIITPKLVNIGNDIIIRTVAASNGATSVCTKNGDIYVLHEYLCRKIASRLLNVVQISIVGGKLEPALLSQEISKDYNRELKVAALTNTGNVMLWQESDQQLCRCIYSINRAIVVKQLSINLNELLLVTDYGEAFKGIIKPRKRKINANVVEKVQKTAEKSAFHKFLEKEDCVLIMLQKLAKINRAICIQSDLKGKDFCVIQAYPYKYEFSGVVESEMVLHFQNLLEEADKSDSIHDVIIKVENKYYPAHKYIISNKSSYLRQLMSEKKEVVTLDNVKSPIFEQFLQFIYTNRCDLTSCGELKNESLRQLCMMKEKKEEPKNVEMENIPKNISAFEYYTTPDNKNSDKSIVKNTRNPVRMLHEFSKKIECESLQKVLSNLDMDQYIIREKNVNSTFQNSPLKFDRAAFPELYDVTIKCRDSKEVKAHKCILSARLEYFSTMFSMRWGGNQSEVTLPFPRSTTEALLEYLYTDSLSYLNNFEIDHLFKVLILADQLFVMRLKEQCEQLLANLITLRNAVHMLSFAHLYHADKLKYCCMQFIILNIPVFLELRSLDDLDDEILKELSEFYFQEKSELWCRVVTPFSTAETDEVISTIASAYPVSLDDEIDIVSSRSSQKKKSRTHKSSISERNSSISLEDTSLDSVIQFPDIPESLETKKIIQDLPIRLKSIMLAKGIVEKEDIDQRYNKLSIDKSPNLSELRNSYTESFDFPELNSPPTYSSSNIQSRISPQKHDNKNKIVRMSQKQRKKLTSESSNHILPVPETPKNPWRTISNISSPVTSVESKCTIDDIILDERKQKENLVKITSKLLLYTQMEDKAIEELHRFYNSHNIDDEVIVIERVTIGAIASPIWVPHPK